MRLVCVETCGILKLGFLRVLRVFVVSLSVLGFLYANVCL